MQCSTEEALFSLFYNLSSSFLLLSLFFYITSTFLSEFFISVGGNPFFHINQDEYELGEFSEEEEEDEENGYFQVHPLDEKINHLDAAEVISDDEEERSFLLERKRRSIRRDQFSTSEETNKSFDSEQCSIYRSPTSNSEVSSEEEVVDEEIRAEDADSSAEDSEINDHNAPIRNDLITDDDNHDEKFKKKESEVGKKLESNCTRDDKFLIFSPPETEKKKFQVPLKDHEEISQDSYTIGSTSKSSSEWRSSINYKDSGTEDPFSSSSRRSCPKWESYTVFQKYDEEMLFLDRISAQKLHETESLRSIQAGPRSISERIVHKLVARANKPDFRRNPYYELEAAYVAQICLTWEALNWNYKYFQRRRSSHRDVDHGCPAYVAQQFQQFQVLLQRYIENEPYEHGRRPEIYTRVRSLAPKLLQVPEYRDSADEKREEGYGSRISSESFLLMMEESIRTFMNFLKADKKNHFQILLGLFKRNRRGSVDPVHLLFVKKANKKRTVKVKDLRRAGRCLGKKRLKEEEGMEIVMALVDLKVVSRVLRMNELSEEQLRWCEDKINKVRVADGKLRRESSPLFFPAH